MDTARTLAIAIAAVVIIWSLFEFCRNRFNERRKAAAERRETLLRAAAERQQQAAPQPPPPPRPAPAPEPPVAKPDTTLERLRDHVRRQKVLGAPVSKAVSTAVDMFGNDVHELMVLEAAAHVGYLNIDIARYMIDAGFSLVNAAELLAAEFKMEMDDLALMLLPFSKKETHEERAEEAIQAVKTALGNSCDDEDLLELPKRLGCDDESAAAVAYWQTDFNLGQVIAKLGLLKSPELVARVAAKVDTDLADEDEYSGLREPDDAEFEDAARILKACGKDVQAILEAEHGYDSIDSDDLDDVFSALVEAGFTNVEVLNGLTEASLYDDKGWPDIIASALERGIPISHVVEFLHGRDVDAEDLDQELRDADFNFEKRIDILHAFIHASDSAAAEQAAAVEQS